ncbi:MAG: class I SAM-dependent methyltransferase [Acidimicrobiaceae bacterium]|nr:class I SAM-dependent methyltransferase [Acidimicrobiaceae bacterium]MBO0747565.1 class I SAM-dependent methyltransferase [Acidimicrobiaceae bacterium]
MLLDLRLSPATAARSGGEGVEAATAILRAVADGRLDPERARVACDWIQYRNNFRSPVDRRNVVDDGLTGAVEGRFELAVDLRQVAPETFEQALTDALDAEAAPDRRTYLERWCRLTESCIWRFNSLYWQELASWEKVLGKPYEAALPGGQSGGTHLDATRELIQDLFRIWDGLAERHALPDQLTVLEIGVGSGDQARVWLDAFLEAEEGRGSRYYERLHYLMADYSAHVLDRARENVAGHRERTSTLVLDASRPRDTLRFLEGKVFLVYISNVYDNLPTEEIVSFDDTLYRVEARAYLPNDAVERIAAGIGAQPAELAGLVNWYLRLGAELMAESNPSHFPDSGAAVAFCQQVWAALRLEERYVRLGALDLYEICEGVTGELLGPVLDGYGDVRMHVSNGAARSFIETLPLLHPLGLLTCHDLFATDIAQYRNGFRGPGKYDGSVVNWVNGAVLSAIAGRRGYQVTFKPFGYGSRSPILTMTARARD